MEREVQHALESAMTTRQLVDHLLSLDPGADEKGGDNRVLFMSNYGDHGHTQQALPVGECDTHCTSTLTETAYSHSGICQMQERDPHDEPMPEPDDDDEDWIRLQS